jgi:hypothetical protein
VCEELLHGLLICTVLEVTADLETFYIAVFVRALDEHSDVVDGANVAFTHINNDTRGSLLLQGYFSAYIFGL